VVLVIAMGIGLFAPPLGLGLYGACLIGDVPIELTVKPMMRYFGLLFLWLLVIAFVPHHAVAPPRSWLLSTGLRPGRSANQGRRRRRV
jgi:TRAP-type C4-dicarboxylate transport system permease large subunit